MPQKGWLQSEGPAAHCFMERLPSCLEHPCSLQSCLSSSWRVWGDSLAPAAVQGSLWPGPQQGTRAGSTGQSHVPCCFKRHSTQAISQLQVEAIVTLVSSLTQQTSSLPPLHTAEAIRALLQASPRLSCEQNTKPLLAAASHGQSPGPKGSPWAAPRAVPAPAWGKQHSRLHGMYF